MGVVTCVGSARPRASRCRRCAKRHSSRLFSASVTSASSAKQRGDREGADEVVVVVEDLDVQRHRVGLAADVAGDHRDRAELAHRARVAQQHAVEQAPLDVGQRDAPGRSASRWRRATSAASSSSVPCACISGISSRATKGKVTKIVASTMPGTAKMILMSWSPAARGRASPARRTAARRSGRRSPARPRTAGRSA